MSQSELDSSDRTRIRAFLKRYADGRYQNSVVEFLPDSGVWMVMVPPDVNPFSEKARGMLSRRILRDLRLKADVSQAPMFAEGSMGEALNQALRTSLGENLIDTTLAVGNDESLDVVIFVGSEATADTNEVKRSVKEKLRGFLKSYEFQLGRFFFVELSDGLPTPPQLLRLVYKRAPVGIGVLLEELRAERASVPSIRWLKTQLDGLIRLGMIAWEKPDNYLVTAKGSAHLPALKGRNSPDIARALDLAKRKW